MFINVIEHFWTHQNDQWAWQLLLTALANDSADRAEFHAADRAALQELRKSYE